MLQIRIIKSQRVHLRDLVIGMPDALVRRSVVVLGVDLLILLLQQIADLDLFFPFLSFALQWLYLAQLELNVLFVIWFADLHPLARWQQVVVIVDLVERHGILGEHQHLAVASVCYRGVVVVV